MIEIIKTDIFLKWEARLKDKTASYIIASRIDRLTHGHFGDMKSLRGGVSEMRVDYGPGYRLYYTRRGREIILLLCGGTKGTQQRDIEKARNLVEQWSERNG